MTQMLKMSGKLLSLSISFVAQNWSLRGWRLCLGPQGRHVIAARKGVVPIRRDRSQGPHSTPAMPSIMASCRAFGAHSFGQASDPRPHGRGYCMSSLRACDLRDSGQRISGRITTSANDTCSEVPGVAGTRALHRTQHQPSNQTTERPHKKPVGPKLPTARAIAANHTRLRR